MKKLFSKQNLDELNLKVMRNEQAEPADDFYKIPNEASCSAEFSEGCIFSE